MLRLFYISFLCLFISAFSRAENVSYASQSVLAEGSKWVKIAVNETGIYKISYSDLRKWGLDPERVSVHGYGGEPLDENFNNPYIDDLPAIAVWRGTDYILFYAKGVVKWRYDDSQEKKVFVHTNNPYSTAGYYFLTDSSTPKEMEKEANGSGASYRISSFDDYVVYEKDLVSVNMSGRELYGESFEGKSSAISLSTISIPGMTEEEGKVTMRFIARATASPGQAMLSIDGQNLLSVTIPVIVNSTNSSYTRANAGERIGSWTGAKNDNVKLSVQYSHPSHKNSYLDYIRLQMKRTLKPYGAYTLFRSLESRNRVSRFIIQEATDKTLIFEVTDSSNPRLMEAELSGSELSFTIPEGDLREFALVQTDKSFPTPSFVEEVENQNLHGIQKADMVIIVQPFLKAEAERLAEEHRNRDGLTVEVIEPQKIYNEFSSGTPDASAYRRFIKMLYDKNSSEADKPKYLLLFGDGIFDNRALTADVKRSFPNGEIYNKLLLTFQSQNSLDLQSYVTDDYFGFLDCERDNTEAIYDWKMDIGVGRMPLRTLTEAKQSVDKIISYMDNAKKGTWKNKTVFVGDDGNNGEVDPPYMRQADGLGKMIENNNPEFLVNRILFDAYKKDFSGQTTYPDVRNKIQQLLKDGVMLINYVGHGDTQSWSDEKVLTQTDIAQYTYPHLPVWITATCDFTRFDALATSAGEQIFLNKKSGGIASFTTTRVVIGRYNYTLNQALIDNIFKKDKNGRSITLGNVMKATKNSEYSELNARINKLNFILIGDPALRLSYPEHKMKVTSINGVPVTDEAVTFKALQKITVEGEIIDDSGNRITDFNGTVNPTVLDSKVNVKTLDNNRTGNVYTFTDYPNTLFVGNDKVENGVFRFSFVVPKDISYSDDYGKMNLYASDSETGREAQGVYQNFTVGGTEGNAEQDMDGPEIKAYYLNDSTFVSGDKVNTTPLFVAHLWDKSGINISGSSVGHDMMLIIDGTPSLSYNLNSYYKNLEDKEGEGNVIFPIPSLTPGVHSAEFIVWDIYNNSTKQEFTFEVVEGLKPRLSEIYATPNPARELVEFRLYHNRPEAYLTVNILVYDTSGRLIWRRQEKGSSDLFNAMTISWDLIDNSGARMRPGIYFYRAAISTDHSKEATKANKLIILAQ